MQRLPGPMLYPGDIIIEGGGGNLLARFVHFGTRKGFLGLFLGPVTVGGGAVLGLLPLALLGLLYFVASVVVLEGRSWANHVSLVVMPGEYLGDAVIMEGTSAGFVITKSKPVKRVKIYRAGKRAFVSVEGMMDMASHWLGQPFGFRLLGSFAADYLLGMGLLDVVFFRRHAKHWGNAVCSSFLAVVTGCDFGKDEPRQVSPDDIADYTAKAPPEEWFLVFDSKNQGVAK